MACQPLRGARVSRGSVHRRSARANTTARPGGANTSAGDYSSGMLAATMATPRKTTPKTPATASARPSTRRKAPAPAPARADGRVKSALTLAAEEGARAAKRELLLRTLDANDWNFAATARALGLTGTPAVIRALNEVAPDEYERAKRDGRVAPGKRN